MNVKVTIEVKEKPFSDPLVKVELGEEVADDFTTSAGTEAIVRKIGLLIDDARERALKQCDARRLIAESIEGLRLTVGR